MDVNPSTSTFTARLAHLGAAELTAVAAGLRDELATAEGEVAWWRATVTVSGILRRDHRTRLAGLAAHDAAAAVVAAARAAGFDDDRWGEVTTVARAAAEAARTLVAAQPAGLPAGVEAPILAPWADLLHADAAAA